MSARCEAADLSELARDAIYDVIAKRRDIRAFRPGLPLEDEVLHRILAAAHQAPSVGYSQPWDFIVVRDLERRTRIRESFLRCRAAEAIRFPAELREKYLGYRLEGILESSLNLCVTVDLRLSDEPVLGTTAQPEALRWSACCSVQNLWLAARAEGVGVGWVSIVEPSVLRAELRLPQGVEPVAYLCVGYPVEFRERPLLEETGWRRRRPLAEAVHLEAFPSEPPSAASAPVPETAGAASNLPVVPPVDRAAEARSVEYQRRLTKPAGSLGRLEELAAWYAGVRGEFPPRPPESPELFLFAGDHGVTAEGVSAYSSSVTAAMVLNFLCGGAAVSSLADSCSVQLTVVDVGVAGDLSSRPVQSPVPFVSRKVRAGTRNLRREAAMSLDEARQAVGVGMDLAREAAGRGCRLLLAGEMGIGNTTAATAVICALTALPPEDLVGTGAGLDDASVQRKLAVLRDALALHRPQPDDPWGVLAALGGFEIAGMVGLMLMGASARVPVMVDGFISGAAALLATCLNPAVRDFLCFSHLSAERGHRVLCRALGATPLLDLGMRLGEGSGAVLAAHLLRAAVRMEQSMATFSTAGIEGRAGLAPAASKTA